MTGGEVFGNENGVMSGDPKILSSSPVIDKIRIPRDMVQARKVLDVHATARWILMEMGNVFLHVTCVEQTPSLSKDMPNGTICGKKVRVHLLAVVAIDKFVSFFGEIFGVNLGPNRDVGSLIWVKLLGRDLVPFTGAWRPRWESPCRLVLVNFKSRPRPIWITYSL